MTKNGKHENSSPAAGTPERKLLCRGLAASPGLAEGKVVLVPGSADAVKITDGDILVTTMTKPDMIPALRKAGAVVTDEGGRTCHAAILSRELGIPCIVGARNATAVLAEGQNVIVDATRGVVFQGEAKAAPAPEAVVSPAPAAAPRRASQTLQPAAPQSVTATKILLNLEGPASVERCSALPADGVGLLRTEFIFTGDIGIHPIYLVRTKQETLFVDKLAEGIAAVATGFSPRPVLMRFSDFRTNDFRKLRGGQDIEPLESNPMLGWRGASRYVSPDYEQGFRLECRAVKKVRDTFGLTNLSVIIPFVRTLWEMEKVRAILESEGLVSGPSFKVWLMVEVPSVVLQADRFASLCDGFTIGSNDLTQLILGVDRDSGKLDGMGYFDERHPSVLEAISMTVRAARKAGIPCSICGEGPSVYPDFAEKLVAMGIDSISVNPDALDYTRRIVASAEQKIILDGIRGRV
ncbi:MAG: hypothetical protein KA342_06495 [Aminivibrio sp.]|jgi:pyruvate,water dikinase|nr:hypothetical protein [Aminivibrio sp.]